MILASLVRMAEREGLVRSNGTRPDALPWIIQLNSSGQFLQLVPRYAITPRGKLYALKAWIPREVIRSRDVIANYIVDKVEYVLGVSRDVFADEDRLNSCRTAFSETVGKAVLEGGVGVLNPLYLFLRDQAERDKAVAAFRLQASRFPWLTDRIGFEVEGKALHEDPNALAYFVRGRGKDSGEIGSRGVKDSECIVCGKVCDPVLKHNRVNFPGAGSNKAPGQAPLVSANLATTHHKGLLGEGWPTICRSCVDGYTTALTRLLADNYPDPLDDTLTLPRRNVPLAPDVKAVFWTDSGENYSPITALFMEDSAVQLLASHLTGTFPDGAPLLDGLNCLLVSGTRGNGMIRGFYQTTFAEFQRNLAAYFDAFKGVEEPVSLLTLLRSLTATRSPAELPPRLLTEILRAIVFGHKYPRLLLNTLLSRLSAEPTRATLHHIVLLRAFLERNMNKGVPVRLDPTNRHIGYILGRLFAVIEVSQADAYKRLNVKLAQRYYGKANQHPALVFPTLLEMMVHYVDKGRFGVRNRGLANELLGQLPDGFPARLTAEERGWFAIGRAQQTGMIYSRSIKPTEMESVA